MEPKENLALDEALLHLPDGHGGHLRFWESDRPFVVLGYNGKLEEEVHVEACEREAVPILRRVTGGGTVLQGPGCLNYTLALSLERYPELRDVRHSACMILGKVAQAFRLPPKFLHFAHLLPASDVAHASACRAETRLGAHGGRRSRAGRTLAYMEANRVKGRIMTLAEGAETSVCATSPHPGQDGQAFSLPVEVCGLLDLALDGRKVSGNAQRRTRNVLLHHGTLLYNFDVTLVERFLKEPKRQPDYRMGRSHSEFLGNLPLTAAEIKDRISSAFTLIIDPQNCNR